MLLKRNDRFENKVASNKKKILFITTLNLASNPRLVKEIRLAKDLKITATVICFRFNNWSHELNDSLLKEFKDLKIIQIDAERRSFFSWIFSVVSEKIFRTISKWISLPLSWHATAITRRSQLLVKALKEVNDTDFVIGHNPGAIYPAYKAAQQFNCKSGFDVEDYHPGEGNDQHLQRITLSLMKTLLPKFNYVSFASNAIFNECKIQINNFNMQSTLVVNNSFSKDEFIEPKKVSNEKLQIVWFSQNINLGRGLEKLIPILDRYSDKLNLTLFGNCNDNFKKEFIDCKNGIHYGGILPQELLHEKLSNFDVGLAVEDVETDKNRDICLTNKIWAYFQSGLYIIATDTTAQKEFLLKNSLHGVCYQNIDKFESILMDLTRDIVLLRKSKKIRFENAQKNNWENESLKIVEVWKKNIH